MVCPAQESKMWNIPIDSGYFSKIPLNVSTIEKHINFSVQGYNLSPSTLICPALPDHPSLLHSQEYFNLLGTGDLTFYQSQGLTTFWGHFFLLNQSFICYGSQFSSLLTIHQEHMSIWQQCNISFFALPSWLCSKWHHNDATMMLQQRDIYVLPVP